MEGSLLKGKFTIPSDFHEVSTISLFDIILGWWDSVPTHICSSHHFLEFLQQILLVESEFEKKSYFQSYPFKNERLS